MINFISAFNSVIPIECSCIGST